MVKELEVALDLARRAGDVILEVRSGRFDIVQKENDEGPVTEADRLADRLIHEGLARAFPNDGLLTEETPDSRDRLARTRVWIVDPLDGTKQFVMNQDEFAVMIGLAIGGRAVLGVVHLPCQGLTYAATEGSGADEFEGPSRRRLVLEPLPADPERLTVAISRSHHHGRTQRVLDVIGPAAVIRSGSVGRKAALVACGEADLYLNLGTRSHHWDTCAPEVVVREAGGAFLDSRGRGILYNTEGTRNTAGLLACRRGLVEPVVAAIRGVLAAEM